MIGIVKIDADQDPAMRACGLSLPLRSLLCMQSAGASALGIVGDGAAAWLAGLRADARVRLSLECMPVLPSEPHVVVDGHVAMDTRAARALFERPGVVLDGAAVLAAHRLGHHDGDPLADGGDGAIHVPGEGRAVWVRVRTASDLARAEDALMNGLRKPQDGVVSRNLNRGISLAITRLLCRTSLRPNQLSVGILGIGFVGAVLASRGTYVAMALGAVLFQAQSVLDGCDGELARVTFRGSKAGEWIDTVGDDLTNYGFFAGLTLGLTRAGLGAYAQPLGAVGLCAGMLASAIEYLYLLRIGSGDLLKYPMGFGADFDVEASRARAAQQSVIARISGWLRPAFKRDFFVLATMLAVIGGVYPSLVMLGCFAVGAGITLVAVLRSEISRGGRIVP